MRPRAPQGYACAEMSITVLIIDERPEVCQLLGERLDREPGLHVVGRTSNPFIGGELAHLYQPDVILADLQRVGRDRAQVCRWLKELSPGAKLVILASYFKNGEAVACLEAGAVKCLVKGMSTRRLAGELRAVVDGEKQLEPLQGRVTRQEVRD